MSAVHEGGVINEELQGARLDGVTFIHCDEIAFFNIGRECRPFSG